MLAFLQKIGKALMLPVATLPAAALLLRFGAINYETEFQLGSSVGGFLNQYIAPFLLAGGSAIFDNLSLIFAVGVAIGLAGDAVAALAAVIAYMVLTAVLSKVPAAMPFIADDAKLNMGVLGGILAGGVAAYCYNRYHNIKLPEWLGFFGGKRFVPIITSLSMVVIGLIFGIIWGPIQEALTNMGNWIVGLGAIGSGLFGFFNRLLIPFGLHHVLNAIAWFQIGDFTDAAGKVVHGDLNRFFAGDKSAGMFMTGFFPIMMFALPAAAFAIIHTAKPEKRKAIASVFIGTALASFLTGITEPLEFAFMFAAPLLYVIHAVLTGISGYIVTSLGIKHGFGFSAGLIDYGLNFPLSTNAWLIIPIGLAFAVVYYFLFRILIVKLNIKTPGREDDDVAVSSTGSVGTMQDKAQKVLTLIGGKENIVSVDACITRLRLVLKDDKVVNEKGLKDLGAAGVMRLGQGSVQVVFGTQSELLKDEITKL
ncbi:PTS acetylglucosamine transporter subunit IIB [Brevibacillus reuszeri]|uniref:PTS acetylglucosamine transporter subunit IIB n=1 Tax=Brevibacillus reuszeri TaxID=54915 RepID=A0A0K9YZU5_9BACL|nr:N-acetylglucosamine-specific PTS transporter subunit IIBC [Brevibacillus reuszeri]KNB74224.1 PTS sugar transporter [Brevibacillus reuszeri]MED1859622.1 N-acetylglucosamine-specific PTS transporter subunit IIBC [Brevibacillus reuszeri]GED73005.1 PTS acetylglucosamine transporter subunit IIB [Brevibacillus reuszeri]